MSNLLSRILSGQDRVLMLTNQQSIHVNTFKVRASIAGTDRFAGKNVMIATREPLACAMALIECDGLAKRIVICPPDISVEHLQSIAKTADIDFMMTDQMPDASAERAPGPELVQVETLAYPRDHAVLDQETEWVLLTSGTTGVPKMVSHSLDSLTSNIKRPKSNTERVIWASFNDARRFSGLQMFLQAVITEACLVLRNYDMSVADFLPGLVAAGATHVSGTPTHWRKVLMYPQRELLHFQQITVVGEIAEQPLLDLLHEAFPQANITHIYGSTESGTGFSVHDKLAGFPAGLLGKVHSGAEFKVEDGRLKVRSVRSAKHYIGSLLTLKNDDGFIDTGDVVQLVGERYMFLGRGSGAINVGGSQVLPEEVEAVLNDCPSVMVSRVKARKSVFTSSILVAEVVAVPRLDMSREELNALLLQKCRNALPPYKVPAIIKFVDDIAINASGKLERSGA